jgi:hypothetical protein
MHAWCDAHGSHPGTPRTRLHEDATMSTLTDIQGYRPAVGDARRPLGSVALGTWRTIATHEIAMPAFVATATPSVSVKRHANATSRPSEAPT